MTFEHLHQSVLTWANERGLLAYGSPCAQYLKTSEELGELAAAMARHDPEKIADALGDVLVTLIILAHLLNHDLVTCLAGAYDEIKDRRGHLRDGVFIKADERTLWLQFRGCLPAEHSPRSERIFRLGDAIEQELARYLRLIPGVELHTEDHDGRQFRFALFGGHFGGSMDGAIVGVPEAPTTWHVWEAKSVSAKRFKELAKKGVKDWSPEYYAQLQCYMGMSGMERALFTAYCKDDSQVYSERVRFVPQEWDALQVKALRILEAPEPPASSYRDPTWYEAKWMAPITAAVYWRERLPPRAHCRNCRFSQPDLSSLSDANWVCSVADAFIPSEMVWRGCSSHQWIHALCPLEVIDTDEKATTYRFPDGGEIRNGADDYHSQELAEVSKDGFKLLDALARDIHAEFDARLVSVADPLLDNAVVRDEEFA